MGHFDIQVRYMGNLSPNTENFKYWQMFDLNGQLCIQLENNRKGGGTLEAFECNEAICIVMCNTAS